MSRNQNAQRPALQIRISDLIKQLESEVSILRTQCDDNKEFVKTDCNRLIEQLCTLYKLGLDQVQAEYLEDLVEAEKEVVYLKELSDSQQIMMRSKVDYIKELEDRYINPRLEGSI